MRRVFVFLVVGLGLCVISGDVNGRGFGGFRGFGGYGGFDRDYSGSFDRSYGSWGHGYSYGGEDRFGGSYSGYRSTNAYSGWGGRGIGTTYDHSWTNASGANLSTSGMRIGYGGRNGGFAAGGTRDTTLTTAGGETYSANRRAGVASTPWGRTVGGASGTVGGRSGESGWEKAFSGNRYVGNMSHYASVYGANGLHSTAYWSTGYMGVRATAVRSSFGYYGCFHPAWYALHPGCWLPSTWATNAAWAVASYAVLSSYCGFPASALTNYDYGSTIVYQNNNVYVDGQDAGTTKQYAEQATAIASQGQTASAPPTDDWKPLGIFALVQGDDKTSNYIFQLAVNKDGIIRGNYYDGVMDTNTEVYGSVDKKTQRAAWTIGKKKDRVFEAGIYNLTQPECPCLLHLGTESTTQMMLVRMQQPNTGSSQPFTVISP